MHARSLVVALALLLLAAGPTAATMQSGTATAPTAVETAAGVGAAAEQAECSFPVTEVDATGTEVTVAEAPGRVTVLGPSTAQTLWEIGAKDLVVGVPHQYAGYLDGVEETTDVSGPGRSYVGNEKVVNTTPDLVLAPNIITNETVSKLRDAGLTVYRFREAKTIQDVYDKTILTGRLVGECDGATETVAWMQEHIGAIRDAVADEPRPKVLVSMGGGFVAGSDTFVHEVVTTAGTDNVAALAGVSGYRELSGETVVEQNPDWIVQTGPYAAYPKTPAYNSTTAVQQGQVLTVDANYVGQPAPRIVYVIENLTKALHQEAYEEAMASLEAPETTATATKTTAESTATETTEDSTPTGTATTTEQNTAETTADDATESGGQPGFGMAIALVALLGAVLVASRRD